MNSPAEVSVVPSVDNTNQVTVDEDLCTATTQTKIYINGSEVLDNTQTVKTSSPFGSVQISSTTTIILSDGSDTPTLPDSSDLLRKVTEALTNTDCNELTRQIID